MVKYENEKLTIKINNKLTENIIDNVKKEIESVKIDNKKISEMELDFKDISEIDFFGYQFIYLLINIFSGKYSIEKNKINIIKSNIIENFENRMGLSL